MFKALKNNSDNHLTVMNFILQTCISGKKQKQKQKKWKMNIGFYLLTYSWGRTRRKLEGVSWGVYQGMWLQWRSTPSLIQYNLQKQANKILSWHQACKRLWTVRRMSWVWSSAGTNMLNWWRKYCLCPPIGSICFVNGFLYYMHYCVLFQTPSTNS